MNDIQELTRSVQAVPLGHVGSGAVLSCGLAADGRIFAGTNAGVWLFESDGWQPLPGSPLAATAVALSPDFTTDKQVLAGSQHGIFVSADAGQSWFRSYLPRSTTAVLALALSPNFADDGQAFAGTAEDGVLFSGDRGRSWQAWNFGLLDLTVWCVSLSPDFARDGTVFAGTTSGLFTSYNGGRAWRELPFPDDAAPILCLAVSPNLAEDDLLLAGTESSGLFRSLDRGKSWAAVAGVFTDCALNALVFSPDYAADGTILAATSAGLWRSRDADLSWNPIGSLASIFALAAAPGRCAAGLSDGLSISDDLANWRRLDGLAGRALTGLVASPGFAADGIAFVFGAGEGVFATRDHGQTWTAAQCGQVEFSRLALSPGFTTSRRLFAAASTGVFASADGGLSWQQILDEPVDHLTVSAVGHRLAAAAGDSLRISTDEGQSWRALSVPWGHECRLLAIAAHSSALLAVAMNLAQEQIEVWLLDNNRWRLVYSLAGRASASSIIAPGGRSSSRVWYAAAGAHIIQINEVTGQAGHSTLTADDSAENIIVALTRCALDGRPHLVATWGTRLMVSAEGHEWATLCDLNPYRPVALAAPGGELLILTLGGALWQISSQAAASYQLHEP